MRLAVAAEVVEGGLVKGREGGIVGDALVEKIKHFSLVGQEIVLNCDLAEGLQLTALEDHNFSERVLHQGHQIELAVFYELQHCQKQDIDILLRE